jgi:3D (Asp-Asp-Asp) domain-containing protein
MIGSRRAPAGALPLLAAMAVMWLVSACASVPRGGQPLVVTATAYNALPEQTDGDPEIGAWGDRLRPGMRAIAVSPDLHALGLVRGARVRIEGLRGEYQVLDRMPRRWQRRIDIFMGTDRRAARTWGKRTVRIHWSPPEPESRWAFLCGLAGSCG